MEFPSTPRRDNNGHRHFHQSNMIDDICQERLHAASKQGRRTRFVLETNVKIDNISKSIFQIRNRIPELSKHLKTLEAKVNRLGVVKEQACFYMSPRRVLDSVITKSSPMKLEYFSPPLADCSYDHGYSSPTQDKLAEFLKRRKVVAVSLSKLGDRVNELKTKLLDIYNNNSNVLRFKRSERNLINILSMQSKLSILSTQILGIQERLFSEDNFNEDTNYNLLRFRVMKQID